MSKSKQEVAERFAGDVAQHVMTVEMDNGVHRCLHFGRPGSGAYSFRVVTWPGYLYIGGDCDDFVFARLTDMFDFFRSDSGRVNLSYWSEKLQAVAKHGGYREFSADRFRETIVLGYREWRVWKGYGLDARTRRQLRDRLRDEVLSFAEDSEESACVAASRFEVNGKQMFPDFWDNNLLEYTYGFMWACHAIVWAIAQYDAAKSAEVPAHA